MTIIELNIIAKDIQFFVRAYQALSIRFLYNCQSWTEL